MQGEEMGFWSRRRSRAGARVLGQEGRRTRDGAPGDAGVTGVAGLSVVTLKKRAP